MTAGAAAPVLIAGIATSSVGTAANVGTSVLEKIINSNQMKDMNAALERDKEISNKWSKTVTSESQGTCLTCWSLQRKYWEKTICS